MMETFFDYIFYSILILIILLSLTLIIFMTYDMVIKELLQYRKERKQDKRDKFIDKLESKIDSLMITINEQSLDIERKKREISILTANNENLQEIVKELYKEEN